ncbi:Cna B-type domain-containing protein, partial [Vagococcus vulneris]
MKPKKSIFMLIVLLFGIFAQLVTAVGVMTVYADEANSVVSTQSSDPEITKNKQETLQAGSDPVLNSQELSEDSAQKVDEPNTAEAEPVVENQDDDSKKTHSSEELEKTDKIEKDKDIRETGGRNILTMPEAEYLYDDVAGNKTIFTDVTMTLNGKPITEDAPLHVGDHFQIMYKFDLPDELSKKMLDGDYYDFELPTSKFIKLTDAQSGKLSDPDHPGVYFGTYDAQTDGHVRMIFNENVPKYDGIDGSLMFTLELNSETIEVPGEVPIEIPGVESKDSEVIYVQGAFEQNLSKKFVSYDYKKQVAKWKIIINPNYEKLDNITLNDRTTASIPNIGNALKDSISIDKLVKAKVDIKGNITEGEEISINEKFDEQGNFTFPLDHIEDPYVMDITTPLVFIPRETSITNWVTLGATNLSKDIAVSAQFNITKSNIEMFRKKSTNVDKDKGIVDWEITYNPLSIEIPQEHAYFSDTVTNGELIEESMTVDPNLKHIVTKTTTGFDFKFLQDVKEPVTIKYQTIIKDWSNYYTSNVIESQGQKTPIISEQVSDGYNPHGKNSTILKEYPTLSDSNTRLNWRIYINREHVAVDKWTVTDNVDNAPIDKDSIRITDMNLNRDLTYDQYKITWHDMPGRPNKSNGFTIDYNKPTDHQYRIYYKTEFEKATQKNAAVYRYTVGEEEKESKDSKTYIYNSVSRPMRLAKSGEYLPAIDQIKWSIQVNTERKAMNADSLLTDVIPSDQELIEDSLFVGQENYWYGPPEATNNAKVSYDKNNNQLEASFQEGNPHMFTVIFNTRLKNPMDIIGKTITNTAVYQDAGTPITNVKGTVSKNTGNQLLANKKGKVNAQDSTLIDWNVVINPNKFHLKNVEIVDDHWQNQIVNPATIRLTYASGPLTGQPLIENVDYKLTYTERDFHIVILDDVTEILNLDYQGQVFFPSGSIPGQTASIKNRVTVKGSNFVVSDRPVEVQVIVTVPNSSGVIQGKTVDLNVRKVDEENENQGLQGAGFTLYRGTQKNSQKIVENAVSNDSGNVLFSKLTKGEYLLVETKAPDGYSIDKDWADGQVIKVDTSSNNTVIQQIVKDPKKREMIDLKVNKKWENDFNNAQKTRPENIIVEVYQNNREIPYDVATITPDDAGDWSHTFKSLPKTDNQGNDYQYSIKEQNVPGYDSKVDGLTITNTYRNDEKTSVSGEKIWIDFDNKHNTRPDSIHIQLQKNVGTKEEPNWEDVEGAKKEIKKDDNQSYTFDGLAKFDSNGQVIDYRVIETNNSDIYTSTSVGNDIMNVLNNDKVKVQGKKTWKGDNDANNFRPKEIKVNLLQDGKEIQDKIVSANDNWKYEFTDLDKYDMSTGNEHHYTVNEEIVPNYDVSYPSVATNKNIITADITNTLNPTEKTQVEGEKHWVDNNNKHNKRPSEIIVNLLRNNQPYASIKTNQEKNWKYTFTDLDKFDKNGKEYSYTVNEEKVNGYETNVFGYDITNILRQENVSVAGKKVWDDYNDKFETRPESIFVRLYKNNQFYQRKEVKPDGQGNWEFRFDNLPKYSETYELNVYTVDEETVPNGYKSEVGENNVITNTFRNEEKTQVSGEKIWDDYNNKFNTRPQEIIVNLLRNNQPFQAVKTNKEKNWEYKFTDLDKYDAAGNEYQYTVEEETVDGYKTKINGNNIFNQYRNTDKTDFKVQKVWDDRDDQANIRPKSIDIQLLQNGRNKDKVELSESNKWQYQFKNLEKYDENGEEYIYTAVEEGIPTYITKYDYKDKTDLTITNTYHDASTTNISGIKVWDDYNGQIPNHPRPKSIEVELLQDGKVFTGDKNQWPAQKVTADDNWQYEFTSLPKHNNQAGKDYVYSVREVAGQSDLKDYTVTYENTNIINTYRNTEKVKVEGKKEWDDKNDILKRRPDSVKILLLDDGKEVASTEALKSTDYAFEFTDLPKYDGEGSLINYDIREDSVNGYDTTIDKLTKIDDNTYVAKIVNKLSPEVINGEKTELSGEKKWDDYNEKIKDRPQFITVELFQNNATIPFRTQVVKPDKPGSSGKWFYTFTDLPKYDTNFNEYHYTVRETMPPEYNSVYQSEVVGNDIINHYKNEEKVLFSGEKAWDDYNDKFETRPKEGVTFVLKQNGKEIDKTVAQSNKDVSVSWSFKFDGDYPKYDESGNKYDYDVVEIQTSDYETKKEAKVDGNHYTYKFTNKYRNDQTIAISGEKQWQDAGFGDRRPKEVIVHLTNHGKDILEPKILNAENNWRYDFGNLPVYDEKGDENQYEIREEPIDHYESSADGFNLINTYKNDEKTEFSVMKAWDDGNNALGVRPESIMVNLLRDNEPVIENNQPVTVELNETNQWQHKFKDLAKFDDKGKEYVYSVSEEPVNNYKTIVNNSVITNKIDEQSFKTEVVGKKLWNDQNQKLHQRPESITVELYKKQGKSSTFVDSQKVKAGADNSWRYAFKDLPKYDADLKIIEYFVKEKNVPADHYVSEVEGTTIINTYKSTEKTELSGKKEWNDFDNKLNSRPGSITVKLYQNHGSIPIASQVVKPDKDGNWDYHFTDLDKYDDDLEENIYTVKEEKIPDYDSSVNGTTIINTYRNQERTKYEGEKLWDDFGGTIIKRPDSVDVTLQRNNGTEHQEKWDDVETKNVKKEDNWEYSFEDLLKYDDHGNEIQYRAVEKIVPNQYESHQSGHNIVNKLVLKSKIDVSGQKTWDDGDGKLRPESITVNLLRDGIKIDQKEVTSKDADKKETNVWHYNFTDLDEYDEETGDKYTYTVSENLVPNYEQTYDKLNITNKFAQGKTQISGAKIWDDEGFEKHRPQEIVIHLYQGTNDTGQTRKLNAKNNWYYEFKDLDAYDKDGNQLDYHIKEDPVEGYTSHSDGQNLVNIYNNNETVELSGTKRWEKDEDDKLKTRPENITVIVLQNGLPMIDKDGNQNKQIVGNDTNWTYHFIGLRKYDDKGREYDYSVDEIDVDNYESTIERIPTIDDNHHVVNIVNTYQNAVKTEIAGEKIWHDNDNHLKRRPDHITVQLFRNSKAVVGETQKVTPDSNGHWYYAFTDLAKYDNKLEEYQYTVREIDVPKDYVSEVNGTTIENTLHLKGKIDVSGEKIWKNDNNNKLQSRPKDIIVDLYQNNGDAPLDTKHVSPDGNGKWKYTFTDLPEYDEQLNKYQYTVQERNVPAGYDSQVDGTNIINTYRNDEMTEISGKKIWEDNHDTLGKRPDHIVVELYQNGGDKPFKSQVVTGGSDNNWTYRFDNLPMYDGQLNLYTYTVKEQTVPGYSSKVDGTKITNSLNNSEKTTVSGKKVWQDGNDKLGKRPDSIVVELYQNDGDKPFKTQTVTGGKDSNWTYTFTDLPKHDSQFNDYRYTVKEQTVPGYTTSVTGTTITNTLENNQKTEVIGDKIWQDGNDKLGKRPDSIVVELYQNDGDKPFKTQTVTGGKDSNWT